MQFFSDYIDFRFKAKHEELNNFYIFLTVPQPLLRNLFFQLIPTVYWMRTFFPTNKIK